MGGQEDKISFFISQYQQISEQRKQIAVAEAVEAELRGRLESVELHQQFIRETTQFVVELLNQQCVKRRGRKARRQRAEYQRFFTDMRSTLSEVTEVRTTEFVWPALDAYHKAAHQLLSHIGVKDYWLDPEYELLRAELDYWEFRVKPRHLSRAQKIEVARRALPEASADAWSYPQKAQENAEILRRRQYARTRPYTRRTNGSTSTQTTKRRQIKPSVRKQFVGMPCGWCNAPYDTSFHLDHIVALANGGTDDIDNLTAACQPCNTAKGAKDWGSPPFRMTVTQLPGAA